MPDDIRLLADNILNDPETVQIGQIAPAHTVSHSLYPVPGELKKKFFFALLDGTASGRVLVFTRTKHRARSLALALEKRGMKVSALQGNMTQNRRQAAINGFRNGKYDILVATDIAARGIDVSEVTHVINYDMPDTVDAYTHRIGRTGRALRSGDAFTIAVQENGPMLKDIERTLGSRIQRRSLPGFDYGVFVPEDQFPQTAPRQKKKPSHQNVYRKRNTPVRGASGTRRTGRRPQVSPR
jgi:ATP-dependent RNA helicase RhlE